MGAEFDYEDNFDAGQDDNLITLYLKVTELGNKLIEDRMWDYGHAGYTGTFAEANGIVIHGTHVFECQIDAERWLENHVDKWGPALAVPYKGNDKLLWAFGALCSL